MINIHCKVSFKRHQCTINDCSLSIPRNLARGVRKCGLYMLLFDPMTLICSSEKVDEPSRLREAHAEHTWQDAMDTGSKLMVESRVDYKLDNDGSVVEHRHGVVGFS
jgi:hypothetical protein